MKWLRMSTLFFTAVLLASSFAENIHLVKPSDQLVNCSSSPCLTLDEYQEEMDNYFTTGSVFIFMTGNHGLLSTLNLTDVTNITLKGEGYSNILCAENTTILCQRANDLKIQELTFKQHGDQPSPNSVLKILNSRRVVIENCTFEGNGYIRKITGGAVVLDNSTSEITHCWFEDNFALQGAAILVFNASNLTLTGNSFIRNVALDIGGAICSYSSSLTLQQNYFYSNSIDRTGGGGGGAIYSINSTIILTCHNRFENNSVFRLSIGGGAIDIVAGLLSITGATCFIHNRAYKGGAINSYNADLFFSGASIVFESNSAKYGGAIMAIKSSIMIASDDIEYIGNTAEYYGGAISIGSSSFHEYTSSSFKYISINRKLVLVAGNFTNNTGKCGAVAIAHEHNVTLKNINATGNKHTALCLADSKVTFERTAYIADNTGIAGGAIVSSNSTVLFQGLTRLANNHANLAGAIKTYFGILTFQGITTFTNNSADLDGGAIHAISSVINVSNVTTFQSNSALNGGAMYLVSSSVLMNHTAQVNTSYNRASRYGGVMYHRDTNIQPLQCKGLYHDFTFHRTDVAGWTQTEEVANDYPCCFLQISSNIINPKTIIHSVHDHASIDGSFLYGGLLDRCRRTFCNGGKKLPRQDAYRYYTKRNVIAINTSLQDSAKPITSEPYSLCLGNYGYCNSRGYIQVHRGQIFNLTLVALAQGGTPTSAAVYASTGPDSRLKISQNVQQLPNHCANLTYSFYSTHASEELRLHIDGPCQGTGTATVFVNVTLLPCPDGFTQHQERCICEERLQQYNPECIVDDGIMVVRRSGSTFWMSALYDNDTYQGLVLAKTCPYEYCKTDTVFITLDQLDNQCAVNRSGALCGACATNHSLMLGSSQCQICSNAYLALLLPFACAGLALVGLLTLLKLTVADGALNALIIYANIVQVNRKLFFPNHTTNVLTVFIAWLNLDLGFKTCFYDGMDAYAQTSLQFVFPLYLWIIITGIIFTSRYSITISKLIGSNPIAVLATLLLMSYTKILKIIIEVYSSVNLDYPNSEQIRVWLVDANVPYLQSKHLALTVVTSLILICLFLPYTFLLLLGHKLYRLSGKKHFHWLNRLKPLLDSYYAPYKLSTRYWTGMLLLVRCALYIVFSYNSLGGTNNSLLAIIITFAALFSKAWFSSQIYRRFYANIIEAAMYLNLVILSATTLAQANRPAVVYLLVGFAFVTMIGIIGFHFYLQYVYKTAMWQRAVQRLSSCLNRKKCSTAKRETAVPHESQRFTSVLNISLREPLLED